MAKRQIFIRLVDVDKDIYEDYPQATAEDIAVFCAKHNINYLHMTRTLNGLSSSVHTVMIDIPAYRNGLLTSADLNLQAMERGEDADAIKRGENALREVWGEDVVPCKAMNFSLAADIVLRAALRRDKR